MNKSFYTARFDKVFKNVLSSKFLSEVMKKDIEVIRIENTEPSNCKS